MNKEFKASLSSRVQSQPEIHETLSFKRKSGVSVRKSPSLYPNPEAAKDRRGGGRYLVIRNTAVVCQQDFTSSRSE